MKRKCISVLTLFMLILFSTYAYAGNESTTTASYRVKPIQEKLAAMTQKDIDKSISRFSDIKSHWAAPFVGRLAALGIVSGYSNGTFMPDKMINIDEFITMTIRSLGFKPESESKYWAQPYIDIAIDQKLVDKNEFINYTKPIKREQAVRIAVKALMLYETAPNSSIYDYIRYKIKDYPTIGDQYKQYVLQSYAMGIISGAPGGYFNPDGNLTRGEAATIIIKNIDTSLRKPMKPDKSEMLTITDSSGKTYEIYPTDRPELFETAVALSENISKTKGYGVMDYNPYDQLVSASFYENKAAMEESDFNIQMGFCIYPMDEKVISHPYSITVFVPTKVKELHMDFIKSVFKYLFNNDSEKGIVQFNRYIDLSSKTNEKYEDYLSLNNRKVRFYKVSGENTFSVWIYSKK